jgi:hypothetical protein
MRQWQQTLTVRQWQQPGLTGTSRAVVVNSGLVSFCSGDDMPDRLLPHTYHAWLEIVTYSLRYQYFAHIACITLVYSVAVPAMMTWHRLSLWAHLIDGCSRGLKIHHTRLIEPYRCPCRQQPLDEEAAWIQAAGRGPATKGPAGWYCRNGRTESHSLLHHHNQQQQEWQRRQRRQRLARPTLA